MPSRHVVDTENHIVLTTFSGLVTVSDIAEHYTRLSRNPEFDASFSEIAEFAETADVQLSYSDFRSMLVLDPFSTDSKRAFVVRSQNSVYGTARMYQMLREEDEDHVKIFSTLQQAVDWLTKPAG